MENEIDYEGELGSLADADIEEYDPPYKEIRDHKIIVVIPDDERKTSTELQLEEMTSAVGIRASQIENGARAYVDIGEMNNPVDIAIKELLNRKSPFILERIIFENDTHIYVEHWKVRDMTYIEIDKDKFTEQNIMKNKWTSIFNQRTRSMNY